MSSRIIRFWMIAAATGISASSGAHDPAGAGQPRHANGEKLESGLGALPHYREWGRSWKTAAADVPARINPVAGEKLDSGLGELVPSRVAADNSAVVRATSR